MDKLKIKVGGIKCDNKECDFKDMDVLFEDYDKWLNKSCPQCGMNLLTQNDFDNTKMLIDITNLVNGSLPEAKEGEPLFKMSVEMDGTGKMIFSDIESMGESE